MFFDKPKPHGFWLAKNWVAFFNISLSSLRMRFSRRSRSFSRARSRSSDDTTSVSRCAVTHLFSVDFPTPRSSATRCRERPLVRAIRTASFRNSSVLPVPMVHLLCCTLRYQRSGTKPRQVHPSSAVMTASSPSIAVVSPCATLIATDPATPILPPPAPDFAVATAA